MDDLINRQPGCEDTVPRTSVEYICRKNTVSTNPYEHKYHDKFIQFMDDPEISDFGRWQHSNGFNTALVAVQCDLDKVPSVTLKQPGWIPVTDRLPRPNEEDGNGFHKAYLVQDGRWMDVARWDGKYWIAWGYSTVLLNVVAWCELPTPYREGGRNA